MHIIIGLGNPGGKYAQNRHNIGFMAVDEIAEAHGFAPWRRKFQAQISDGLIGQEKCILVKPETFMNLSGQSAGEVMRFYKASPADLIVMHDELDLPPGKIRLKTGGGHAGHNGLRSLHEHIGADYTRLRLGIGHPGRKEAVAGFVLSDFSKSDQTWLHDLLRGIADGAPELVKGNQSQFMNKVYARLTPENPQKAAPKTKPAKPAISSAKMATENTAEGPTAPDNRTMIEKLRDKFSS